MEPFLIKTLSEKLQLEADLTLQKAISQARQNELVRQQQGTIRQEGLASNVDRVNLTRPRSEDQFKTAFKTSNKVEDRNQTCGCCGGKPHKRNECPVKYSICNICKRKGHWRKWYKTKTVSEIQSNQDVKEFFSGEIHIDQLDSANQSPWKADIQVNDQVVNFKLDSGADVSVLPASVYDSLKPSVKVEPTDKVL